MNPLGETVMGNDDLLRRPSKLRKRPNWWIGAAVVAVCCVAAIFWLQNRGPGPAKREASLRRGAYIAAKERLVARRLAPATATFAPMDDPLVNVLKEAEGLYRVRGWLDAKDGSGGLVRSTFMAVVSREGRAWKWVEGNVLDHVVP